jgi:2-polyprenyl-3-methyl-5-hydroxy-6-metoxy-1,4-benzoquinol methylase
MKEISNTNSSLSTQKDGDYHYVPPNWSECILDEKIEEVRLVRHLRSGRYSDINVRNALDFYSRRYVQQLFDFTAVGSHKIIADVGAGYAWLSIAFAMCTPVQIIAVEPNRLRLQAAKRIACILGVEQRIDWRVGSLGSLPLNDREADVVYCIEVLEHVYRSPKAVSDLCRTARELLILTTPNLWFPIIAHDTRLPFCHWLPIPCRQVYAKLFRRTDRENNNLFWSPTMLESKMPEFKRVSQFLHYKSMDKFLGTFPCYLPYGRGGNKYLPRMGKAQHFYYRLASRLGAKTHYVMPNLAGVFQRIIHTKA